MKTLLGVRGVYVHSTAAYFFSCFFSPRRANKKTFFFLRSSFLAFFSVAHPPYMRSLERLGAGAQQENQQEKRARLASLQDSILLLLCCAQLVGDRRCVSRIRGEVCFLFSLVSSFFSSQALALFVCMQGQVETILHACRGAKRIEGEKSAPSFRALALAAKQQKVVGVASLLQVPPRQAAESFLVIRHRPSCTSPCSPSRGRYVRGGYVGTHVYHIRVCRWRGGDGGDL